MTRSHSWSDPAPEPDGPSGKFRKTCDRCGLQAVFFRSGDAEIDKRFLVDGAWVRTSADCTRAPSRKTRDRVLTEAQRFAFQSPVPRRRL